VADNLVIDRRRSAQRRERRDDAWNALATDDAGEASPAPSAERAAIAKSELARVAALFDELGEPTTGIFRSYRIDGTPQRDIAAHFGLSLSAVEKHLQKAYKAVLQLRDKLDAEND
jgi:RNA polymerase sigma-70 factor (ECF subfamily)